MSNIFTFGGDETKWNIGSGLVLITVPHAACPPAGIRNCDLLAPSAARSLARKFEELDVPTKLIASDIHRVPSQLAADGLEGSDQNRPWHRETNFSTEFESTLNTATITLDIHSFPPGSFGEPKGTKVILLDPPSSWDRSVVQMTEDLGFAWIKGSTVNWIVQESRRNGIPAILIEFNESMNEHELGEVTGKIAKWMKSFLS